MVGAWSSLFTVLSGLVVTCVLTFVSSVLVLDDSKANAVNAINDAAEAARMICWFRFIIFIFSGL